MKAFLMALSLFSITSYFVVKNHANDKNAVSHFQAFSPSLYFEGKLIEAVYESESTYL